MRRTRQVQKDAGHWMGLNGEREVLAEGAYHTKCQINLIYTF